MTETTPDKVALGAVWERIHKSGGVFDKDKRQFVPMPKENKGARFYVTPAGITITKRGR